jgi:hypothetical protein
VRSIVSVELYVNPASEPISGAVVYPDGREVAFTGWIELTAALEEARHCEALDVVAHFKQDAPDAWGDSPGDQQEDFVEDERL